jgi:diguanylate cyclase (GGDEF)-like protein
VSKPLSRKLDLVFSTFIEVTGLITTGASMSRIVTPILACACKILRGRAAFAILEDGGTFTRVTFTRPSNSPSRATREEKATLGGFMAKISRSSKVVMLRERDVFAEMETIAGLGRRRRTGTFVGAALKYRKIGIGAIGVMVQGSTKPAPEDLELFELLVRQASVAIKNAREFERTQTLSITDGLTGAYNYRFLIDALKKEIGIAERFHEVFSIVMIDLDSLKEYNDVHGHLGGSEVIRQVARLAASIIRAIDMLCKYGGDEFVVVLPRTPKQGAAIAAERLRDSIEKHRFPGEEITGKITASFGIASYPEDGRTVHDLIASADKALYRAKQHGRNKVWLSGKRTPYSPA